MKHYIYRDHYYTSLAQVEEAVAEYVGSNYNNIDPYQTSEYEDEYSEIEIVEDVDVATQIVSDYIKGRK